ncbi:MAG: L-fucose/L-arabinose isomerase family protein [Spirochaetaceae bacterium]|jgi:L-arabinose isomerase|nr:L-fucose/L-arabinose isomerase family protein [Spirochaetaceae bacterium]
MIEHRRRTRPRIGLFGVGHETYWSQFEGLLNNLMKYHNDLKAILPPDIEIIDYGMVDTNEKAFSALNDMRAGGLDILFCNMLTYATSSVFAPIIRDIGVPVVLTALQPRSAMDYTVASTFMQLENDNICSVPEFTGVAIRMGRAVNDVIIGKLYGDEQAKRELADWCDIARVLHDLKGARIGLMGHVLESMYDMHADPSAVSAAFGLHVPLIEPDYLLACYTQVTEREIEEKAAYILEEFDTPHPGKDPVTRKLTDADLRQAAKSAVALDKLVERYRLTGLAYYYEGLENSPHREICTTLIVGNSILNGQGFPMCGEYDLKTCVAMLIMDRLGMGGSFAEFHPFDFDEDFILVGHDGPHHTAIANGKPVLRSLIKYHGKPGHGASVEFNLKEGPITMLGITQTFEGKMKLVIGEGQSVKGPIPPTGNTNTRGFFLPDTRSFIKKWVMEGPTHHYALGIGHRAELIKKIGRALGIESVVVRVPPGP